MVRIWFTIRLGCRINHSFNNYCSQPLLVDNGEIFRLSTKSRVKLLLSDKTVCLPSIFLFRFPVSLLVVADRSRLDSLRIINPERGCLQPPFFIKKLIPIIAFGVDKSENCDSIYRERCSYYFDQTV